MRGTPEVARGWAWRRAALRRDAGMSTAEYAIGTLAAVGLATILLEIVTGGGVRGALQELIEGALSAPM